MYCRFINDTEECCLFFLGFILITRNTQGGRLGFAVLIRIVSFGISLCFGLSLLEPRICSLLSRYILNYHNQITYKFMIY